MKQLLFLFSAILIAAMSFGQTEAKVMLASNGLAVDTVTNTATETWTLKVPGFQKSVSVQAVLTKISGTVAGTVTLQGSLNGTSYYPIPSQTYTATDVASQTVIFGLDNSKYLYYRLSWTGTGTMAASARGYLVARN